MTSEDRRKVIVRLTVEYPVDVPADWGQRMIEFHRNDSSWCINNALDELTKLYNTDDQGECMCTVAKFEYVREA